jgi:hypothetical protein
LNVASVADAPPEKLQRRWSRRQPLPNRRCAFYCTWKKTKRKQLAAQEAVCRPRIDVRISTSDPARRRFGEGVGAWKMGRTQRLDKLSRNIENTILERWFYATRFRSGRTVSCIPICTTWGLA